MDNITKIKFEEWQDETYDDGKLWAGHYGQVLQVEGLTLPDGHIEVHFSLTEHTGDAHPYIGTVKDNVITVDIPNFIFQKENIYGAESYEAYAFIYQADENSGQTIKKITFTIQARPNVTANVPEDQKDPFLEEVRQVMAETKQIAQSVREDADNGGFDGEKGEKGDAGSIEFKIVSELPTENIDESVMYLLQSAEDGNNKFLEYIYVEGEWECIGSASVEVNLDDYVKNTDYATKDVAGVVKVSNLDYGLELYQNGILRVKETNEWNIINARDNGKNSPVTLSKVDLTVKEVLKNPQVEWTDKEKANARNTIGAIGTTIEGKTTEPIVFESSDIQYGWDDTYYGYASPNPFTYDDIEDLVISYNIDFYGFIENTTLTYGNPSIEYYSFQEEFESCGMEWNGEFKVNIETSDWGTISISFGFDDVGFTQTNEIFLTIHDIYGAGESGDEYFGMTLTIDKKGATKEVITIDRVKANDVVLTSPNGTNYTVTVDDSGKLTTTRV